MVEELGLHRIQREKSHFRVSITASVPEALQMVSLELCILLMLYLRAHAYTDRLTQDRSWYSSERVRLMNCQKDDVELTPGDVDHYRFHLG